MRKIYFLFLFALIASMSGLQAQEEILLYETGFESSEGFKSSTTYNNANLKLVGPANQQWGTICGTPSINSVISGEQSMQMRYYNNVGAAPYVLMDFDLQNVSKVVYKAKTANESNNTLLVQHSTDGGDTWSEGESYSLTTSVSEFTYVVEGENTDVRFKFTATNTPVEKKGIIIDDVKVYGEARLTAPIISGVVNGETYYGSALVSISYPDLATSMTYTITKDGAQYKQETVTAAVEDLALNEAGSYKVEASATDGSQTLSAEAVEFTIVDGGKYTVTDHDGTTLVTAGAEGTWTLSKTLTHGQSGNTKGYQLGSSKNPMGEFTLTLDKEYENIVSVIVNAATGGSCTLSVTVGGNAFGEEVSLTEESANYEFTGNASGNVTLNFNASEKACYLKSITIITSGNDTPVTELVAPTIDGVTNGETYYEEKTITITCPTEGAEILYTVTKDGEELATDIATSPIELKYSESGVYEIEAMSSKGEETSEAVTVTFTIKSLSSITSVADFIEIGKSVGDKVVLQLNCPLTVTYKNARSIYAIDAEGSAIQIFANDIDETIGQTYNAGDVIPAGIQGNLELFNGDTPEITNPVAASFQPATETAEVSPIEKSEISLADVNQYVVVRKVTIAEAESANNYILANEAGTEFAAYQNSNMFFNGEVPVGDGKEYDVTGIVSTFKGNVQITITGIELSVEAGVEGVEAADAAIRANADGVVVVAADAVAEVYNAAGQLVATAAVDGESVIAVPAGFYVVRVGNTIAKVVVR